MFARVRRSFARPARPSLDLELGVEAGQVVCPNRGIVDIEVCFSCPRYRGLRGRHDDRLVCAVRPVGSGLIRILVAGR